MKLAPDRPHLRKLTPPVGTARMASTSRLALPGAGARVASERRLPVKFWVPNLQHNVVDASGNVAMH